MVPDVRPRRALLLGLGAGTIARLLHARFGPVPIVGVDDDPSVLAIARHELADLPGLALVDDDAFAYVARTEECFDLACIDLYRGAQPQTQIVSRPFLRQLRARLAPRGRVAFNLFVDRRIDSRVRRIGRVFRVLEKIQIGKNLVVWCR
jgi:spermidine synthase